MSVSVFFEKNLQHFFRLPARVSCLRVLFFLSILFSALGLCFLAGAFNFFVSLFPLVVMMQIMSKKLNACPGLRFTAVLLFHFLFSSTPSLSLPSIRLPRSWLSLLCSRPNKLRPHLFHFHLFATRLMTIASLVAPLNASSFALPVARCSLSSCRAPAVSHLVT